MNGCTNSPDVSKFFDQEWDLYKKVIELNYMAHREILVVLRKFFSLVSLRKFSVLELGCVDASLLTNVLLGTKIETYYGVDISQSALINAEENMRSQHYKKCFIKGDLLEEVGKFNEKFDVIVAGYSFHHLNRTEKGQFFRKCRATLKSGGKLIVYDEVCQPGENRNGFINRFSRISIKEWNMLSNEELLRIYDHVEKNDYPETFEFYMQLAKENGFEGSEILFHDKYNLYGVFSFST